MRRTKVHDAILPIEICIHFMELGKCADQPADIILGEGMVIHEDHACMVEAADAPIDKQRLDRPDVIRDERQLRVRGRSKNLAVGSIEEATTMPIGKMNGIDGVSLRKLLSDRTWHMRIEEKAKHLLPVIIDSVDNR